MGIKHPSVLVMGVNGHLGVLGQNSALTLILIKYLSCSSADPHWKGVLRPLRIPDLRPKSSALSSISMVEPVPLFLSKTGGLHPKCFSGTAQWSCFLLNQGQELRITLGFGHNSSKDGVRMAG